MISSAKTMKTPKVGKTPEEIRQDLDLLRSPAPGVILVSVPETRDSTFKPKSELQLRDQRRRQYALGRAAAYGALNTLGFSAPPIVPRGQGGMPVWPEGVVGSITHIRAAALAAVARSADFLAVGIDLQELRDIRPDFCERIGTAREVEWCRADSGLLSARTLALFSGKESVYKALYPSVREFFGFSSAELIWNPDQRCFDGRLLVSLTSEYTSGFSFSVFVQYLPQLVFTAVVLKR